MGVGGGHVAKALSNRMVQLNEFVFVAGRQSIVGLHTFHHIGLNFVTVTLHLKKIQLPIRRVGGKGIQAMPVHGVQTLVELSVVGRALQTTRVLA